MMQLKQTKKINARYNSVGTVLQKLLTKLNLYYKGFRDGIHILAGMGIAKKSVSRYGISVL